MKKGLSSIRLSKKGLATIITGLILVLAVIIVPIFLNSRNGIVEYENLNSEQKNEAPLISKIEASNNKIIVNWDKVEGADKYLIYRKDSEEEFKEIATLDDNETNYVDENVESGKEYTYKVVSKDGFKSYASLPISVVSEEIKAPQLVSLERVPENQEKDSVLLTWKSEKNGIYYILRKNGKEDYSILDKVITNKDSYTYKDENIDANKNYTYSVRRVKETSDTVLCLGKYDNEGISSVSQKPNVKVDFTNLRAKITWDKLDDFDHYEIFRKISSQDRFKKINTIEVNGKSGLYEDVYHDTFTNDREKSILAAQYFMDPSVNGLVYTVRGYNEKDGKRSYSSYMIDGDFHLEAPSIVKFEKLSNSKGIIEWSTIKNAHKYYIYGGHYDKQGQFRWERLSEVKTKTTNRQSATIKINPSYTHYTVKAVSTKNGKTVYSDYDKGFTINKRKYEDKNVLFFGDSITFGSPYKGKTTRDVFSYPWRVKQLTNINFYNPSIPGSTYTYKEKSNRSRMINIADCLNQGRNVTLNDLTKKDDMYVYQTDFVNNQINGKRFKDFDAVIMAVGTNDYLDDNVFGDINSTNIREFNGAVNKIMGYIQSANEERAQIGKKPIKVVFVDLFYSDRTYDYAQLTNRFKTKNKLGLTLTDYQNNIDSLVKKYKNDGMDVYQFETIDLINEKNCPYVASDNLHMTRFAYGQIGNKLADYLIKNKII